jgi:hypothetical protein
MMEKAIIPLFLTIALLISVGCTRDRLEENSSGAGQPVIEYNDTVMYKDDVIKKMNYYLAGQGMTIEDLSEGDDEEIWERFKNDIIFELSFFQIALHKAEELGLDDLSPAEEKKIDDAYNKGLELSKNAVQKTGDNSDFDTQLNEYLFLRGYDLETYRTALEREYIVDKVKDSYTKDITVSDETVRAMYDKALEAQKNNLEKDPDSIEQLLLFGADIFYYPEGYMYAKHILISFDSADSGAAAIAYVNGNVAKYNRIVDEAIPKIQGRVDMIMEKLNDGEDFDDLMVRYSNDSSLNEEPYLTRGFLIGPYSSSFDIPEYLAALETLEAEGEFTDPVTTYLGVYIITCEKMLAGPVPYEEIKDRYKQKLINQRKEYAWSALGQEWVDKAKADGTLKYHPERLEQLAEK